MHIALLLQPSPVDRRSPVVSPLTAGIVARLQRSGVDVDLVVPEAEALDRREPSPRHDLYVLRSQTAPALRWAAALAKGGAPVINTAQATALARDKVATAIMLSAAGVPVSPSWTTGRARLLFPPPAAGALSLEPPTGRDGIGAHRVSDIATLDVAEELTDAHGLPLSLFVQREAPANGVHLKVYAIAGDFWAMTRSFPARTVLDKLGTPALLTPEIHAAVARCGRVLGLELYGVDVLVTGNRFVVVDVDAFPGYKGVAEAPEALAAYLHYCAAWQRAVAAA
jgi:ribosomal protein S6--L-glutamate ligase